MRDVMVDIETLGTSPGSIILSIGAVEFDPYGQGLGDSFYINVDEASSRAVGLTHDDSTVAWWADPARAMAKLALSNPPPIAVGSALGLFHTFVRKAGGCLWGHGATFDSVLIEAASKKCGQRTSWLYHAVRDTRTLFAIVQGGGDARALIARHRKPGEAHHNALVDAMAQARAVQECMGKLKSWEVAYLNQPKDGQPINGPRLGRGEASQQAAALARTPTPGVVKSYNGRK